MEELLPLDNKDVQNEVNSLRKKSAPRGADSFL